MEPLVHASRTPVTSIPTRRSFRGPSLIVVYPYLTGLVAGAFTVSSLYQVFGFQRLKPVAHFALLTSLCCMLSCPCPCCCTSATRSARSTR